MAIRLMQDTEYKGCILLIQSISVEQNLLLDLLTGLKYIVSFVSRSSVTVSLVQTLAPDLILLDDNGTNNYQFCEELKLNRETSPIPVIFCATSAEIPDRTKIFQVGGADYLLQPFQEAEISARLETQIKLHRLQAQVTDQQMQLQQQTKEYKRMKLSLLRLSRVFEQSPNSIVITDLEGRIEFINPAFTVQTGYSQAEALGKNPRILKAGYHSPAFYAELWETITQGQVWQGEFCNRKKNGELYWEFATIAPIKDHEGATIHYLAIKENISQHKQAAEALQKSQALFQSAFHHASVGMALTDALTLNFLEVNQAFCDLFGYLREELLQKSVNDLAYPPDKSLGLSEVQEIFAGKQEALRIEKRYLHKNGKVISIFLCASVVYDTDGRPRYFVSHYQDITERKETEKALKQANYTLKITTQCRRVLIHAKDEATLLNDICQILVQTVGYRLVWIGFAENDVQKTVRPVAQVGYEEDYLRLVTFSWGMEGWQQGPPGQAIRAGKPVLVRDLPATEPWSAKALELGYASAIAVPLLFQGQALGTLNIYAALPNAFEPVEVRLLEDLAADLVYGLEVLRTRQKRQQAEEVILQINAELARRVGELTVLYKIARMVSTIQNMQTALGSVAQELTKIFRAQGTLILLLDKQRMALLIAAIALSDSKLPQLLKVGEYFPLFDYPISAHVIKNAESVIIADAQTNPSTRHIHYLLQEYAVHGLLVIPLSSRGKVIGSLVIATSEEERKISSKEVALAETIATQVASAIENTHLLSEQQKAYQHVKTLHDRLQAEMNLAHEIQKSLLPPPSPAWEALEVVCYSVPAREVGGDLYAYHKLEAQAPVTQDRYAIAVGDVTGKGMPAALLMAVSLSLFRSVVEQGLAPSKLLTLLDKAIEPYTNNEQMHCALCYVEITPPPSKGAKGLIRIANSGLIPPFLKQVTGPTTETKVGGPPLGAGLGELLGYPELTLEVVAGDLLVITSDGVAEAANFADEMFGFERLKETIAQGPTTSAQAMLNHLKETLAAFVSSAEPRDDVTIVVVQVGKQMK